MAFLAIAPTGTVLPFAGTTAPEGWVLCDSGEYLKTSSTYAKLFAVVGTAFGETNGSGGAGTSHFRVPDMRGVFPRGSGTNGTANYGGVTGHTPAGGALAAKGGQKTAKNGLSSTSSAPVFTGGAITGGSAANAGTHQHTVGYGANIFGGASTNPTFGGGGSDPSTSAHNGHTHTVSGTSAGSNAAPSITVASTDTETTPASLALNYIIKL